MFDLIIRSDRVVTPAGVSACDIAIEGEKIAAVAAAGTLDTKSARRLIDMTGKIVMPGGVGSSRVDLQACKLEYSIVSPK